MTSESKSCGERRLASHIMPISVSVFAALLLSILPLHAQELSDLPRTRQVQIAAETAGENLKNRAKEEKLKAEEEKKRLILAEKEKLKADFLKHVKKLQETGGEVLVLYEKFQRYIPVRIDP